MSSRPILPAVVLTIGLAFASACSDGDDSSPAVTTAGVQSFECVAANQRVDLTTGTPVGVARDRLEALLEDESLVDPERSYHEAQLDALDGVDGSENLGDRLDAVPCDL